MGNLYSVRSVAAVIVMGNLYRIRPEQADEGVDLFGADTHDDHLSCLARERPDVLRSLADGSLICGCHVQRVHWIRNPAKLVSATSAIAIGGDPKPIASTLGNSCGE